jgi:hypothetical protein
MPSDFDKDVVYFGRTNFRGADRLFGVKRNDRRQHMYVVGKTGTGKTTVIKNMVIQDIANGEGVCVVDPHGEFVEELLEKIPQNRINDVIYFNPADPDYHIGFNVLELPDPKYKHLVASGLMGIFTKIWAGVWSARMEYILNNCIMALLETPGTSLLGITRILVDKEYRQTIVNNVTDPVVKAFWINEYEQWKDQFRNEAIAPIQNKVGQFLSTAMIRNIVGQSKSTINIFDIMNSGKIFLVNVSKGRIGEDNSALLGSMIITKIQLSAMERVRIPEDERVDFYLYVDEFQNFATDSFANILSEARKYRLNLIMAHQYIGQLVTDVSTKVRDAVFGNVGTMIVFRVGAADAEFLEKEFEPEFMIQDMVNLPNRSIYLKLMVDGVTSRPFSASTLPPFKPKTETAKVDDIIQNSRKRFARPRYIVESEINRWSGLQELPGAPLGLTDEAARFERSRRRDQAREQQYPALAELGIEFELKKEDKQRVPASESLQKPKERREEGRAPKHERKTTQNESDRAPFPRSSQAQKPPSSRQSARKEDPPKMQPNSAPKKEAGISLEQLKPREEKTKPKHEPKTDVDLGKLRESISEALKSYLKEDTSDPPQKQ